MKPIVLSIDRTCSLSTIPIPVPTEGEVLINPVCVPVHTLDLIKIRGVLGSFSGILGFEGAGSDEFFGGSVCYVRMEADSKQ